MDFKKAEKVIIRKRNRTGPNKKWMETETKNLLEFLRDNHDFEKPTSQMYYNKFLATYNINCDWKLVKNKVRNLRLLFKKAKAWKKSPGAGTLKEGETVKDVVERICPYYGNLDELFGQTPLITEDINTKGYFDDAELDTLDETLLIPESKCTIIETSESLDNSREDNSPCSSNSNTEETLRIGKNGFYSRTRLNELVKLQEARLEFEKEKLVLEKQKFDKEMDLEERKFAFEKEKAMKELELKKLEIEKNERLRLKELEMNEKIAIKELELKYKNV